MKNKFAVALGKMAKGKPKTGLSASEIERRRNLALANSAKMRLKRQSKILQNSSCNNP
jgi:hypothetical protein